MKAFFILDTLANAGTEKSYLQLLPQFSEDLEVFVVYFYADHSLLSDFQNKGIKTCYLGINGKYGFYHGTKRLVKLIKEEKPDVLVSSLMRSNLISRMAAFISGVPLIGTLVNDSYNPIRLKEFKGTGYWKFKFFWLLDKWTSSIPKYWIANAKCLITSHSKSLGIDSAKADVVYRGRKLTEKKYNCYQTIHHFVGCGRLISRKGWTELLDAFHLVLQKNANCTLTIFGEGPLRSSLEEKITKLGLADKVFLPGNVAEVQEKLFDYDCFVFPSWYEGFSGALLEAMMVGIPIIASDIPMNLEAITPDKNALTFPVKDAEMLAKQMTYAINNPQKMAEMGQNAREEAIERFDIEKIAKAYERVLRRVLNLT
ncbi:glycosyltransferase [Echinicola rosea]|uniref:Glycosyl transferase family 1 n=1 Tax=Echinicola rosea TaxID=1807691 RepID=A0ABQ1VBY8_9BACT|nr:glycosyltransferase [Echinicola rosea]GGF46918.1 glycosyl transferase family 1 [Echinicola rosea]